jgi:signal peptidase
MTADDGRASPPVDDTSTSADDGPAAADDASPPTGDGTGRPREDDESGERPPRVGAENAGGRSPEELLHEFLTARHGLLMVLREVLVSVAVVGAVGLLLFALSGVWPPMVAVESGSMEPHMHKGDLVFVSEPGRYVPDTGSDGEGVVTRAKGAEVGYRSFGGYGSVVVYDSPNRGGPPVIHRAHFWVNEGENWYDEADPAYHNADSCLDMPNCPAPHDGFITKGDNNGGYDQVLGISQPVRPGWVVGIAHVRVPYLGYIRLWLAGQVRAPLTVFDAPSTTHGPVYDASLASEGERADREPARGPRAGQPRVSTGTLRAV